MKWKFAYDLSNNRKSKFVPNPEAGSNNTRQSSKCGMRVRLRNRVLNSNKPCP